MRKFRTTLLLSFILLIPAAAPAQNTIRIKDTDIGPGQQVTWTSNNTYVISGAVFVEDGATLNIEAGTVVKAETGQGNNASALVISRGGKILALGTATRPIIFTSVLDDVSNPNDLTYKDRGLWGGVVLLGRASTNNPTPGGVKTIEGLNEIVGQGDTRADYGGADDNDNSGILRYVSIRHTGINIGDQSGNEIQGLTLGGVGSGTTIEYVESFASADDGFEFFGGTVNTKYLVSAFNSDDAFDYDEGFRGKGQFWFALLATDEAGAAAEQDGATNEEFYTPFAIPQIYNATYIGPGVGATPAGDRKELMIFRDNAGGKYYNSIFTDFQSATGGLGITVEDVATAGAEDSRARLEAGDIVLMNNIWWGFGAGNQVNQFSNQSFVQSYLSNAANANQVTNPLLRSIGRTATRGLDPRPAPGSPALSSPPAAYPAGDAFFTPVPYIGAFGPTNWLTGWTALDQNGFTTTATEPLSGGELPTAIRLNQNYPNPFNPSTTIAFELDGAQPIRLTVFDVMGREVAVLADGMQPAGVFQVQFDASRLASGTYFYQLRTAGQVLNRTMTLVK